MIYFLVSYAIRLVSPVGNSDAYLNIQWVNLDFVLRIYITI